MGGYWSSIASIGKVYDISGNASSIAQFVAQSFLKDLGSHILKTNAGSINYVPGADIAGNGRDGVTYTINGGSIVGIHHEATFIPEGNVSGTWTAENSPYYIEGPLTIENNQTLTIEPGVKVAVRGSYYMTIQGTINALGTEDEPIQFSSSNPNIYWNGLDYNYTPSSNDTSLFDNCIFQYGLAIGEFPFNCGGIFAVRDFNKIEIRNSIFRNNIANQSAAYAPFGGAISLWNASPIIHKSIFYNNIANYGGAIMCYLGSNAEISRCLFYNNQSAMDAGALQIYNSNPTIINNTFSLNTAGNSGGAIDIYDNSSPELVNNIFWGNTALNDGNQISILSNDCSPIINYCDVEGGEDGIGPYGIQSPGIYENNIDEDPLFLDIDNYNFLLDSITPSVCIDNGDPSSPADPDGSPADIGCYYQKFPVSIHDNLKQNLITEIYPNPITESSSIYLELGEIENIVVDIFNIAGQNVCQLIKIKQSAGSYSIPLDIQSLHPGTYFCRIQIGNDIDTKKIIKY